VPRSHLAVARSYCASCGYLWLLAGRWDGGDYHEVESSAKSAVPSMDVASHGESDCWVLVGLGTGTRIHPKPSG
jgi:hypothetical protein